jgi:carbonic anhydrase
MQRRHFLRGLVTGAVVACPVCQALAETAAHLKWSHAGATGPEHWSELDRDFAACGSGTQQSPIDLAGAIRADLAPLDFAYGSVPVEVEDIGHTLEMKVPPGHVVRLAGDAFTLIQFHFHAPSEHRIDGHTFPMEAHFVHLGETGTLAVVAVMLAEGAVNQDYAPLFAGLPLVASGSRGDAGDGALLPLSSLLPVERSYYRYAGSLTTPDCAETVTWLVLRQPVPLGASQIARFTTNFPSNARPLQPINRRFVLRSF